MRFTSYKMMKAIILLLAVVVFFGYPSQAEWQQNPQPYKVVPGIVDSRCPRNDDPMNPIHFPMRGDCSKFMKCYAGRAYEHQCPEGLEFSVSMNRCDYPDVARCSQW
ncbi:peritrophin-1-like [Uranotaenia lowii]|uniref:peritrophin-1-like n=1 Tax=Uranotaenia lowii TaxID=190385 RepID=UPI002478D6B5|nr:peritrophin-1-like [Uranotaenia lowii]